MMKTLVCCVFIILFLHGVCLASSDIAGSQAVIIEKIDSLKFQIDTLDVSVRNSIAERKAKDAEHDKAISDLQIQCARMDTKMSNIADIIKYVLGSIVGGGAVGGTVFGMNKRKQRNGGQNGVSS